MAIVNTTVSDDDYYLLVNTSTTISSLQEYNTSKQLFSSEVTMMMHRASTGIMVFNICTLMFGMGAATNVYDIWYVIKRPIAMLIGLLGQTIILPALGLGICKLLQLPVYQSLSVLILAACPPGANSNFFTYWMEGDIALSIILTSSSTLLSFVGMPLNLWIYTKLISENHLGINYMHIIISMIYVTAPTILGMALRYKSKKIANTVSSICSIVGWLGVIVAGILILLLFWNDIINTSLKYMLSALLIGVFGFVAGYVISLICCCDHKTSRTIALEVGCQNMVVAVGVILLSFDGSNIRGPMITLPALYGLWQVGLMIIVILIFQAWRYIHRDDVTVENAPVVEDSSILYRIPIPAAQIYPRYITTPAAQNKNPHMNEINANPVIGHYTIPKPLYRLQNREYDDYELQTFLPPKKTANINFPPPPNQKTDTEICDSAAQYYHNSPHNSRNNTAIINRTSSEQMQQSGLVFSLNYVNDANVMRLSIN